MLLTNLRLLANYNQTMNARLYQLASGLPVAVLKENKGAFFGSIQNTLNHLLVADLIWLRRFEKHPAQFSALTALDQFSVPTALDQLLYEDFALQFERRKNLDALIVAFVEALSENDLAVNLHYRSIKDLPFTRNFGSLLLHFFNHQTHHRGQATTLLSQCGIDVGVTDFLALIPDLTEAN